jgi:two-component system response regulator DegU
VKISILIADDHSMIREGLKQLLELEQNFNVIGFADNGRKAIDKINELHPDILLLDVNMPVLGGIETLAEIRKNNINVKVIMLTIHNEREYLIKAVELGCDGYILKESDSDELKNAIYNVYEGKRYIQPNMTPMLNSYLASKAEDDKKLVGLTKREIQVLKLVAEGMFNRDIAERLEISERTVKNHIANIFKKIQVSDRTQAAVFAIKNNLTEI